jgi:hypothetical protein
MATFIARLQQSSEAELREARRTPGRCPKYDGRRQVHLDESFVYAANLIPEIPLSAGRHTGFPAGR